MIHQAIVRLMLGACLLFFVAPPSLADNTGPVPYLDIECHTAWTVPGATDDYLLGGLLVDARWDRDGNLCFVDYKNKDLKVFSREGEYQRTLGREGEGPGESLDARRMLMADDGRVGLLQVFPARIVWLRPDGNPGGKLTMENTLGSSGGYVAMPHAVQYHDGIMAYVSVVALTAAGFTEDHWIAPANLDGTFSAPIYHRSLTEPTRNDQDHLDETDLYAIWAARWAPDGRGGAWVATERDEYVIAHHADDGSIQATIERAYSPVQRDSLGRQRALEQLTRKRYNRSEIDLRDTAPVVSRLRLADNGNLWVELDLGGHGPRPGVIAYIDEFAPDGTWLRQLRLHGDYDPEVDRFLMVDDRHLVVLHAGEDEEMELRLMRLTSPAN